MARQTTIDIPASTWTQLTDSDVTNITFQNVSLYDTSVFIKAATDATPPTNTDGAYRYAPGEGELLVPMASLFPGITGADRLWAYSVNGAQVVVSHA